MKNIIVYIVLFLCSCPIIAQTERELTVSEIRQQTVLTEPITLQKGYFKVTSQFNYSVFSTTYYNNNWEKTPNYGYLSNSFIVPFSVSYGLNNNLELNISSNYVYSKTSLGYKSIDYYRLISKEVEQNKIENGFNDISFAINYSLFSGKTNLPSMGFAGYFTIPYGKTEPTSSDSGKTAYEATSLGSYELGIGYLIKKVFYPFSISGTLLYSYSFPTNLMLKYNDTVKTHIKYGDYIKCQIALNYLVSDWISIGNTLGYSYNGPQKNNDIKADYNTEYLKYAASLTFQIKNIRLTQGISFYLKAKAANTSPLAYITLAIKI